MLFDRLTAANHDPILSLIECYRNDPHPLKLDLGIGVYRDEQGLTPVMNAVKKAEYQLAQQQDSKAYLSALGHLEFNQAMIELILGDPTRSDHFVAVQTPGASGALRILADLIKMANPDATIWLTQPSYANHEGIMRMAGLRVRYFEYYDVQTHAVSPERLLHSLAPATHNDVVLLHGCCHNPTGADLEFEVWQAITDLAQKQGFLPFIDIAYQGFGQGLDADMAGVRHLASMLENYVIASSCSKNFGLYRERTGIALVACQDAQKRQIIQSRLLESARGSYTMAPDHGAAVVATILTQPELRQEWQQELDVMCQRLQRLRQQLVCELRHNCGHENFDFIAGHKGMFSLLGLSQEQLHLLRHRDGLYLLESGRINIAGVQSHQIPYLATKIADVQRAPRQSVFMA